MPFDLHNIRLTDLASWVGVTPVPLDVLEAHKIAEVNKRPGSRFYRHIRLLRLGLIFGVAFPCIMLTAYEAQFDVPPSYGALIIGISSAFLMMWVGRLRLDGPAQWHEEAGELHPIPEPIRQAAARVMEYDTGDMRLVVGRLVQKSVVLDPYLVIERGNDRICLGIWDDAGIIHLAT